MKKQLTTYKSHSVVQRNPTTSVYVMAGLKRINTCLTFVIGGLFVLAAVVALKRVGSNSSGIEPIP
jgi:hypothetical protein